MNYEAWKALNVELVARNPALRRLDCMNPVKALAELAPALPERLPEAGPADLTRLWRSFFGGAIPEERATIYDRGVRPLLRRLFRGLPPTTKAWCPVDVYPVYLELAREAKLEVATYETCPSLRLPTDAPADRPELLLVPNPMVPAGRPLSKWEADELVKWLDADPRRIVFIDAVYTFGPLPTSSRTLVRHPRAVLLHSLAKSFLRPDVAGVAFVSPGLNMGAAEAVDSALVREATYVLDRWSELPHRLQATFVERWAKLAPLERALQFRAPRSGYFSISRLPWEALLEHGALAVPSTVFGAARSDFSVVTCLLG